MLLIGRDLSPFVRRCATVFNLLGLPYERKSVATEADGDFIRQHNPLGRVPALVLDDAVVVDSAAIVDYALDTTSQASNSKSSTLLSASGVERRQTLYLCAIATGVMEKVVASAYEVTMRPSELVYPPYLARLRSQALAGLIELDGRLSDDYFGGAKPSLADVNAVIAYDQMLIVSSSNLATAELPRLSALSARANQLAAFATTRWSPPEE